MRIEHRYVTFEKDLKLTKLLDRLTIKYKLTDKWLDSTTHLFTLEFYIYEDNPRFNVFKAELNQFDIKPQIGTKFDKTDLDSAEWFVASSGQYQYPQPEDDYLNRTFNLKNYCNLCGIELMQNNPFRLSAEPKQHNNQFWGLHWLYSALFVRQETKNILEKEGIKGITFSNPVLDKTNNIVNRFYQLHNLIHLPKGFDHYNTKQITCKVDNEENCNTDKGLKYCGSIKYHYPTIGGFLFNKKIFDPNFDIVHSNEYFGSGGSADKLNIVSKKFKQIVDKYKLKGLYFSPIVHERIRRDWPSL